jgi:hypothetical protein
VRPATPADIRHICQTLWERGRIELTYLGISPEDWMQDWLRRINRGTAVAFESHAILGWDEEEHSPGHVCTSFQASQSFESPKVGLAVTKQIRRAIPELMKRDAAVQVNTYSLCVHPEAEKWFRLLGLTEDTQFKGSQCGPFLLRKFIRR